MSAYDIYLYSYSYMGIEMAIVRVTIVNIMSSLYLNYQYLNCY